MPTTLIERPQPDMGLDQASDKTLPNVVQQSLSMIGPPEIRITHRKKEDGNNNSGMELKYIIQYALNS